MQFSDLYGTELDRELGSADRTQLFTTVRRQAAINAAQLEFVKRTECLQKQTAVAIVSGTGEYDLESTLTDFMMLAKNGVSLKIVSGTTTRYIEGDDLQVTSIERLNQEHPGWRSASAGTPYKVYIVRNGGAVNLGFYPAPSVTGSDTWTALVTYVQIPADMVADADLPFTVSGNALLSLRPWYRALAHYGAYDCEKYRKDEQRGSTQFQLFELELQKFSTAEKPKTGQTVRFARNYRARVCSGERRDPRA